MLHQYSSWLKHSFEFLNLKKGILSFTVFLSVTLHSQIYPYQDNNLSFEKRADDLLSRLTIEEKISLMMDSSQPVKRLGIKKYNWWNEALHGVARAGQATVFPQPIGMSATFDKELIYKVFSAVSDEARAKHTIFSRQGSYERYQGLTMWTPTINIFRDPRWGRGIETYGEDPFLTSLLGVAAVRGLQGSGDLKKSKYDKVHACAKHFAVHSGPEWNRHSFNAKNIKTRDLYETYLPAFEALVKEGNVQEVMCAYNRFEGEPCCGNDQLLMQILRKKWGFQGIVVSDCGAIADFYKESAHNTHTDAAKASAAAVLSGTDLECGSSYKSLMKAMKDGDISESAIDISVKRLLLARFKLGEMDRASDVEWTRINPDVIASQKHAAIALEAAQKSIVLLQNRNNILPLKKDGIKIAVMGPNANDSIMQWGNYNGTPKNTVTILQGIKNSVGKNSNIIYEQGCGLVEDYVFDSAFAYCKSEGKKGMSAKYWNNISKNGDTVLQQLDHPFSLCTSGDTVFAQGVQLKDFSAEYNTFFEPAESGEASIQMYVNGKVDLKIDGKIVVSTKTGHGPKKVNYQFLVEKGKKYQIEIDFAYHSGDAQLNFDIGFQRKSDFQKSLQKVSDADVIVFVGGISPSLEGEEMGVDFPGFKRGDRTDIELPQTQKSLLNALEKTGKQIIYINCSGSAIALDYIANMSAAVIQAWYPGQEGGTAVADILFGDYNPSGHLPITFYKNSSQLPDFENYDMEGRTYRYLRTDPLFVFGHGLSYSSFKYGKIKADKNRIKRGQSLQLSVLVKNKSKVDGTETVQLYLKKKDDHNGPNRELRAVKKIFISAGKSEKVDFLLEAKDLKSWNAELNEMDIQVGIYTLEIGGSSKAESLKSLEFSIR
ncbi:glycoside hydrolase family 3 C-terminal domain-containing protein [Chryseobacterium formosus]|uniref:Glycoside hydrolase family 3 C-terminal domain-containing protein n=1 Tax=Chryseobacterium formosus TaxID=1537363 RepID=A0ABT3XXH4_9FLAO|nr:xylan 1,4-beta-xylosidase [Chryseobacterium formosus]MCX8526363.1 glycoside hydrolase family 3 C-terminal domain-containing protein [Chryseobacterium formosus]